MLRVQVPFSTQTLPDVLSCLMCCGFFFRLTRQARLDRELDRRPSAREGVPAWKRSFRPWQVGDAGGRGALGCDSEAKVGGGDERRLHDARQRCARTVRCCALRLKAAKRE
jgi:hypothetical protein